MASFRFDTELLTNMVAATPVKPRSTFSALLHPATKRPAVIGISSDQQPKLELISEDEQGHRHLYDFGQMLGIPAGSIECFGAQQAQDMQIYMVIAYRGEVGRSQIMIVKPFSLAALGNLQKLEIRSMPMVEQFFVGPVSTPGQWPLIIAAHQRLDRVGGSQDLARIRVIGDQWEQLPQFNLPENASQILDVCAGSTVHGQGVWCLYVIQDQRRIIGNFASQDRHGRTTYQIIQPRCPSGATALESFTTGLDETSLLIASADGLSILTERDSRRDGGVPRKISSDDIFKSPSFLSVSQDGDHLAIWSVGRADDLGYSRTTTSEIENGSLKTSILMPVGSSSGFAATIAAPDAQAGIGAVAQSIITNGPSGNLSWLQQNADTGIWKSEPFLVMETMNVTEIPSYTITATAIDSNGKPVAHGSVFVTADSTVQAWVNGAPRNISSQGTRLPLDAAGELNVIIPTETIAGRLLNLEALQNAAAEVVAVGKTTIDPTAKVMKTFSSINEDTDLESFKGRNEIPLYGPGDDKPNSEDLKNAAKCFGMLNKAMKDVTSGPSSISSTPGEVEVSMQSIGAKVMDGLQWLKEKMHDVVDWVIEKVGEAWTFVCKLANETKRFILDCVEKIGEAAMWVWNKIKIGIKKLVDFFGFLFKWEDVRATRNTVAGFLDAGLAFGSLKLKALETKVDGFFVDLEKKLGSEQTSKPSNQDESKPQGSKEITEAQGSSAFKWILERLRNGGAGSGIVFHDKTDDSTTGDTGSFAEIFKPIGDGFGGLINDLASNISTLFHDQGSITNGTLWEKLGKDFLKDGLKIIKAIVLALIKVAEKLFADLIKIGKKKINVPILSWLWKKISGNDLTLFDAVSLILGFMICTLSKLVSNEKPPSFSNMGADFIEKIVSKNHSVETKRDLAKFGALMSLNVTVIIDLFSIGQFFSQMISKGGAGDAVKGLTPGTAVLVMKTLAGVLGLISAYPTDEKIPGYELRKWTVYLGAATLGSTALFTFTSVGGPSGPKKMEIFNCAVTIVNFGLYNAIYASELDANAQYEGKDTKISSYGIVENVFLTVAVAGRCIAVNSIDGNPIAAGVALAVMHAANNILAINKGFTLSRALELKSATPRGVAPST